MDMPNITGANIRNIEDRAFHGLGLLSKLILDQNKISYITSETLYDLPNLQILSLKRIVLPSYIPVHLKVSKTHSQLTWKATK
jgi:hypothetical protein